MSHQPMTAPNQQSSTSNQQPTRGLIIFLWIGIVLFLATAILGVLAFITKQNTIIAIITFLATLLSIPIGILQVHPPLFAWARQTIRIGFLVFGIVLLVASLGVNVYVISNLQIHKPPVPTPTAFPTVMTPIHTGTPSFSSSPTPPTPPALVQKAFQSNSATVIQVMFSSNVTARDLIVVAITQWEGTVTNVTDTGRDTYIPLKTKYQYAQIINNVPHDFVELYYAKNVVGGATTVTVHFSTAGDSDNPNDMNVGIYEFSGLDTTNPVDQQPVSNIGYSSIPDGGTLRSIMGNEVYFVVGVDDDGNNIAPTAGSGYTLEDHQDDSNNERFYVEDRVAGPGSFQTNFSIATPSYWAIIGVSFKSA